MRVTRLATLAFVAVLAACDAGADAAAECRSTADAAHPDVVAATLEPVGDGTFRAAATMCSAYDTPARYADAWRLVTPDGDTLGIRELLHHHAGEQPFTRPLVAPVVIPDHVPEVLVQGRDSRNGWGGGTLLLQVP